jgi:hypothetical protein
LLLGIAAGGMLAAAIVYICHWYRDEDRGMPLLILLSAQAVAILAATLPPPGGSAAILPGLLSLALGAMALRFLPRRPDDAVWLPADEWKWLTSGLRAAEESKPVERATLPSGLGRVSIILIAAYSLSPAAAMAAFFSPYSRDLFIASLLAAIPLMLLLTWSSRRRKEIRWHTALPFLVAALAACFAADQSRDNPSLSIASAALLAAGPLVVRLPGAFLRSAPAARTIGVMIAVSALVNLALSSLPHSAEVLFVRCLVTAPLILVLPKFNHK